MKEPTHAGPSIGFRLLVGILALASLAHVGILFPRFFSISGVVPPTFRTVVWALLVTILTAVGACTLALVLAVRSWQRPGARSLALFLAFLSLVWGSLLRFLEVRVTPEDLNINLSAGGLPLMLAVAGIFLSAAAFIRFSALFPVPLTGEILPAPRRFAPLRRLRVLAFDPRVVWGSAAVLILLHKGLGSLVRLLVPGGEADPAMADASNLLIPLVVANLAYLGVLPLLGIGLGIRNLGSGYRMAPKDQKRRVLWLVSGISAAGWLILGGVLTFAALILLDIEAPGWVAPVLAGMVVAAPAVLVITTALALFYSGAVDPGLVLKRSTVMGALGVVGILLFAGLEEALSAWVERRADLPGMVGSVLAGAIAAGVMLPLRKGLERAASRVLPGQESSQGRPDAAGPAPMGGDAEG